MIVALADQPLINAQDITALIGAFKKRGDAAMVVPRVTCRERRSPAGQSGDLRRRAARAMAVRQPPISPAASGARQHPERVRWFDTDNRRYRVDIDTPEDLERFAASTGHTLSWPPAFALQTS